MKKLCFYEIDQDYINFLKKFDGKIPNIAYQTHDKFICGVLFEVEGKKYYAPISSFTKQQRTNILIRNSAGQVTSSIRLSFMFPVPDDKVHIKDFSKEDAYYRRLLLEEYSYCKKHAHKIADRAQYIYHAAVTGQDPVIQKNSCNFKKLESAYEMYINDPSRSHSQSRVPMKDRFAMAKEAAAQRNADRAASAPTPRPPKKDDPSLE